MKHILSVLLFTVILLSLISCSDSIEPIDEMSSEFPRKYCDSGSIRAVADDIFVLRGESGSLVNGDFPEIYAQLVDAGGKLEGNVMSNVMKCFEFLNDNEIQISYQFTDGQLIDSIYSYQATGDYYFIDHSSETEPRYLYENENKSEIWFVLPVVNCTFEDVDLGCKIQSTSLSPDSSNEEILTALLEDPYGDGITYTVILWNWIFALSE